MDHQPIFHDLLAFEKKSKIKVNMRTSENTGKQNTLSIKDSISNFRMVPNEPDENAFFWKQVHSLSEVIKIQKCPLPGNVSIEHWTDVNMRILAKLDQGDLVPK